MKIIDCNYCGFKHIFPLPSDEQIDEFYEKQYYDFKENTSRAPDLQRLSKEDSYKKEYEWRCNTLFSDIHTTLVNIKNNKGKICDVGCGTGDFLKYMDLNGWKCTGVEPSKNVNRIGNFSDINIITSSFQDFVNNHSEEHHTFDVVTLLNVLEHVVSPVDVIDQVKMLLKPKSGILVVMVPNDFSEIQNIAREKLDIEPWWIAIPDHINYFNKKSLKEFLESDDFEIIHSTGDFPMEFFLLQGDNYIGNQELGKECHNKRVEFELALPSELRRSLYQKFAELGIGREILIYSKFKGNNE